MTLDLVEGASQAQAASEPRALTAFVGAHDAPLTAARIMIVDDNTFALESARQVLKEAGFSHVTCIGDAIEALGAIEREKPDLLIIDLMMPRMSGFELVARLRASPTTRHTPILVQTAMENAEDRMRAFDIGASDLIEKPIQACEAVARVRTLLQNRRLIERLSVYRRRMEEEIRSASEMQRAILPKPEMLAFIRAQYGLAIDPAYEASLFLGGDIWGVRPLDEDRVFFYIADFSGHGVAAAMNTFRLHTFIDRSIGLLATPTALMAEVNRFLMTVLPVGQFATMLAGVFDVAQRRLTYASAGAPPPIQVAASRASAIYCPSSGPILRLTRKPDFVSTRLDFEPGDRFVVYSDVFSAASGPAPAFQPDELLETAAAVSWRSETGAFARRMTEALAARVGRPFPDDLTLVGFRLHEDAPATRAGADPDHAA